MKPKKTIFRFKLLRELNKETAERVLQLIKSRLPNYSEVLVLSLTGSRAFGWGDERYDYDVHGIFAAKDYWDYVHLGKEGFDINLWELGHVWSDIYYQHFEFFMNLSNPFYIHPKFNFKSLMNFCKTQAVHNIKEDILRQIHEFEITRSPRSALHSYRMLMIAIHFLKTKRFILNIYELNKKYKFVQLEKLKQAYIQGGEWEVKEVKNNLNHLLKEYYRLCRGKKEEPDIKKAEQWLERMKRTFY
jgi:predicted nucleotidyltransferase